MTLTVVTVSPRVAPGLLAVAAWDALRAGLVRCLDAAHPQLPALAAAGIAVEIVDTAPSDGVLLCGETVPPGVTGEVLAGSWDVPGAKLLDAVAVMDRLRSPGGCPWDAEQTHRSLMPYLLEEAYEAYQSLEDDDDAGLREELGDLLLQVLFHARLAEEHDGADGASAWSIDDVAGELVDKLVSRHPHVFARAADGSADGSDDGSDDIDATEVNARWEELKAAQKGRTSVTDGVPLAMAALSLAAKLQRRAAKAGVADADFDAGPGLGAELWALVARARAEGIDPEEELRTVARAYRDHLREAGH